MSKKLSYLVAVLLLASVGIWAQTAPLQTITATTGMGLAVLATSPTLTTPALGTPSAIVLTNASGFPAIVPALQFCGTTTTCSHTAETTPKMVFGSAPLVSGAPSTATVTGISPAFTATADYVCTVSAPGASAATALIGVTNVSSSSFTITGPATVTTVISYICVGF